MAANQGKIGGKSSLIGRMSVALELPCPRESRAVREFSGVAIDAGEGDRV